MEASVNENLKHERKSASFNVNELTEYLYHGKNKNDRRRKIVADALKDDVYTKGPNHAFLSREESYSDAMRKAVHYLQKAEELNLNIEDRRIYSTIALPNENNPLSLHLSMFMNLLNNQTTEEQKAKWLPLAQNYKLIGTYAQTELGHGTNIRALETTATYDPSSKEFIIHSPSITAMKWWPGGLGKTTNCAVVMAQLYTKGRNYGMHAFLVQTRDLDTHQPLPGITIGDIGPKFGFHSIDNGFLKFNHVRIPRENMLMKYAEVTDNGTYVSKGDSKLTYGAMVMIRAGVVGGVAAEGLAQAVTIAIRYSCVRHQSELKPGAPEPQILDYQAQQYKLLPNLATAIGFWFTGEQLYQLYLNTMQEIKSGNTAGLQELHALSAGLKAFSTWASMWGIEQCRLACGGHGFSMASGIQKIYLQTTPACTYEGENTVMMLQTARYLIKSFNSAIKGGTLAGQTSYLSEKPSARSTITEKCLLDDVVNAYKARAYSLVRRCAERIQELVSAGQEYHNAWNLTSVDLVAAASAHCHYFVVKSFSEIVQNNSLSENLRKVLRQLCELYAAHGIVEKSGEFFQGALLTAEQFHIVQSRVFDLLAAIRPNAVALVDAFDYPDHVLQSCLGRYDGNVYESLYEWAKQSPLNKTEVHDSFHKYIKPQRLGIGAKL